MERQSDIHAIIAKRLPWEKLDDNFKQLFHSSNEYYEELKKYCFSRRLPFKECGGLVNIYKEEDYYASMIDFLKKNLLLYPYEYARILVNKLGIIPFHYYMDIVQNLLKQEKSYDILPNFTASDLNRLVGVSRNEYIEILNKARGKKWMWRLNKGTILQGLLPKEVIKGVNIEHWWEVECIDIPQNEFLNKILPNLNEKEKETIGQIKARGKCLCGEVDRESLVNLHRRDLIFFTPVIKRTDYIIVPTLKNFIMNRKPTDYFEKIVYDILVTIDERTRIEEIANVLEVDVKTVIHAVSLCSRCSFAMKKVSAPQFSYEKSKGIENGGKKETATKVTGDEEENKKNSSEGLIKSYFGIHESWTKIISEKFLNQKGIILSSSEENLDLLRDQKTSKTKKRRVGFLFDNSLTAHLMFGNLGQEIKRHAVTLFEIGKLTDENIDDFLKQLDLVEPPSISIGEASVYYQYAISLRQTLRFLRNNPNFKFNHFDGGVDMVRCESLQHLDSQTKLKILKSNFAVIVTQAPLNSVTSLPMCMSNFFGPSILLMNSHWFKFFLYEKAGCGPSSLLLRKGERVNKLPGVFLQNERVIFGNWEMDPSVIKSHVVLQTINDSLSYNPVIIQALQDNKDGSKISFVKFVFPFDEEDIKEYSSQEIKIIKEKMNKITENMYLQHSFGNVKFMKVKNKNSSVVDFIPMELQFGANLENDEQNKNLWKNVEKNGTFKSDNIEIHNDNMNKLTQDFIDFLEMHIDQKPHLEKTNVMPTNNIFFDGKKIMKY